MTVRIHTHVLAGTRIEIAADGLLEGQAVEVAITPLESSSIKPITSIVAFLDSLPPGPRIAKSGEELDRLIREERDAWDR